jgi:microsomal dipeptidase-like Zn-dependent dipeptidase
LGEIRSRGGVVGLPGCETPDELKRLIDAVAALPFEGRSGYEGIAIGSDLLGIARTAPGLASARDITRWLGKTFDRETASSIAAGNATRLLLRSAGVDPDLGEVGAEVHSSP